MNDRFLRACRREPVDRTPLWIMRQAGRYLPEYRALRGQHDFLTVCRTPELAVEVTLQPLRRFPLDAAILFSDILVPVEALGVPMTFSPGPTLAEPLRTRAQVDALTLRPAADVVPYVAEAVRLLRRELDGRTPLIGFCGAPWTLAAYLVEGRGTKEFPLIRSFAAARPDLLDELLRRLSSLMGDYLIRQAQAGADAVQIFDSWAGLLSLEDWQRLIKPHLESLLTAVGAAGVPRILFLQNAPHLVDAYAELPAEVLATDWRIDLGDLQRRYPARAIQGNIDPAVLLAGADATRQKTIELLERVAPTGHIVNLGHGILPQTPIASVEALIEVVHG
jgi:uroporphyrinogen decarboxylase